MTYLPLPIYNQAGFKRINYLHYTSTLYLLKGSVVTLFCFGVDTAKEKTLKLTFADLSTFLVVLIRH